MTRTQRTLLGDMAEHESRYAHVLAVNANAGIFWRSPESPSETRAMRGLFRGGSLIRNHDGEHEYFRLSDTCRSAISKASE
jgi:hypothetical protein